MRRFTKILINRPVSYYQLLHDKIVKSTTTLVIITMKQENPNVALNAQYVNLERSHWNWPPTFPML